MKSRKSIFSSAIVPALLVAATALTGVACSGSSTGAAGEADAAKQAPPATRAPADLGEVKLPPLNFVAVDDKGTVSAEITAEALFDLDSAQLKPAADSLVQQLAGRLSGTPTSVRVDGYTDGLGSESHNKELSTRRAQAFAERISALGTAKSVLACGMGEKGTDGTSEDPAARRVVVTLGTASDLGVCP